MLIYFFSHFSFSFSICPSFKCIFYAALADDKHAPPSIVIEELASDDYARTKKSGILKKEPQSKSDSDSKEDAASKGKDQKSKGRKVYIKKPTTILEELEEGRFCVYPCMAC